LDTEADTVHPEGSSLISRLILRAGFKSETAFVLRVAQPALVGMIDGTVSSLAPIFAAAISSDSHTALLVGLATALGAVALMVAGIVVAVELFAIAWVRHRFLTVSMRSSLLVVTVGGVIALAIGVALGNA
jgi:hypothetical protein